MKEGHDVCEHQSNVCEIQIGGVARGRRNVVGASSGEGAMAGAGDPEGGRAWCGADKGRRGEGCGQPAQFRKARGVSAVRFLKKLEK